MGFTSNVLHSYQDNEDQLIKFIADVGQKNEAFKSTLGHLGADTFLIEEKYVDKDYLADYANFYARCYPDYPRFCKRVHFFKKGNGFSFTTDILSELIKTSADEALVKNIQDVYLGFIVLKPSKTDDSMIGKTCLSHYPNDEQRNRAYTATRDYSVNLFGIPLSVTSMAFQEQDETVAMCASIALWSAFNITGKKYQHRIPSPSEVTNLALSETSYKRDYPNEGLTIQQMGVAMAKVELKPLIIRTQSIRHLKAHIYAYLRAGIPVVCGLSLYNEFKGKKGIDVGSKSFHAVTINGFSFEGGVPDIPYKDELNQVSSRMTRFYAHDDQLCPFTKMEFDKNFTRLGKTYMQKIKTTWQTTNLHGKEDKFKQHKVANIESLIIPLYHKIRISYFDILDPVQKFANTLKITIDTFSPGVHRYIEWDIFLSEVSAFKREILAMQPFQQKEDILQRSFAKYLWRAQAIMIQENEDGSLTKEPIAELVLDSTDSKKKGISSYSIFYQDSLAMMYNHTTLEKWTT